MATFTPELTFGPWASGMLADDGQNYRTIQLTGVGPVWLLTGGIWADNGIWSDSDVWED